MDYQYKYTFKEQLFEAEFSRAFTVEAYWGNKEKYFFSPIELKELKIKLLPPNV